jgi:hypothetical protein
LTFFSLFSGKFVDVPPLPQTIINVDTKTVIVDAKL